MRNAMAAAKRDKRFRRLEVDETTLRIDNRRIRGIDSLRGCIISKPSERPSDIIRRAESERLYWEDEQDTLRALDLINKHFSE
jgi:hypothetical protein